MKDPIFAPVDLADQVDMLRADITIWRLAEEAVKWWMSKCPTGWEVSDHLKNPTINCHTDCETKLALAVVEALNAK